MTLEEIKQKLSEENYLILKYVRIGEEYRFLLAGDPDGPTHYDMTKGQKTISAGFCTVSLPEKTVNAYGKSSTLSLEPVSDDSAKLTSIFFTN
jgi:hypothetical protein